jgi:hypothetical protein
LFLILPLLLYAILMSSCGSTKTLALNSVKLTNQLQPGMSYDEVEGILGKPKSTQVVDDKWIARWNLQEMWRGYIPYDMVFDAKDKTLISWSENTKAFEENQAQLQKVADELSKQSEAVNSQSGNNAPAFETDPELMKYFAGSYYSFSAVGGGQTGGTERRVSLCPDGKYLSNSETGYSGEGWGSASQGGAYGTWRITGNKNSGTIVTTDRNGKSTTYKYETCGNGCIYFGNNKFGYAGAPNCQ